MLIAWLCTNQKWYATTPQNARSGNQRTSRLEVGSDLRANGIRRIAFTVQRHCFSGRRFFLLCNCRDNKQHQCGYITNTIQ